MKISNIWFWLRSNLQQEWERLITHITQHPEVRVWQQLDKFGNVRWCAYDPATNHRACLSSEAEMRYWIEQRYYH